MRPVSILHISDLHLGANPFCDDAKLNVPGAYREATVVDLCALLARYFSDSQPDVIAITGDITENGKEKGFAKFKQELFPLLSRLVGDPRAICIVPGNHDVVRNIEPSDKDYYDIKFRAYKDLVEQTGVTSALLPTGTASKDPESKIEFNAGASPLFINKCRRTMVLCVNSAIRCGEIQTDSRSGIMTPIESARQAVTHVLNNGVITDEARNDLNTAFLALHKVDDLVGRATTFDIAQVTQCQRNILEKLLDDTRKEFGEREWSKYTKLALLHHHIVPFGTQVMEHKPFDPTLDGGAVLSFLAKYDFQIVLTGHKHQRYQQITRHKSKDMIVLGAETVCGHPAFNNGRSVQYIECEQMRGLVTVSHASIPCGGGTDSADDIDAVKGRMSVEVLLRRDTAARYTWEEVDAGLQRLYEYAKSFAPDHIIGINRGGAIVGGCIGKQLGKWVKLLTVDDDLEDPKVLEHFDGSGWAKGEGLRLLLVDDSKRRGRHSQRALKLLEDKYPKAIRRYCVLLEVQTNHPGPEHTKSDSPNKAGMRGRRQIAAMGPPPQTC